MSKRSRDAEHFDRLYQANPDPWNFQSSRYEQTKYESTLAALGSIRYRNALEVGCSIGVLTSLLAARCDHVIGVDFATAAVTAARVRCAALGGVRIEQMQVPQQWPDGAFDLILFSEVLYFLDQGDLQQICRKTLRSLLPGGRVLLVNYTEATDDPTNGDQAALLFIAMAAPALQPILQQREPHYRLDLLASPAP